MYDTSTTHLALPLSTRRRVGIITTYPPSRCGIATYSASLVAAMRGVAPCLDVDVIRLLPASAAETTPAVGTVGAVVDPDGTVGRRAAARRLNESDAVIIQHEYGIFGKNDGEGVLEIIDMIHRPKLAHLHTVLAQPTARQHRIISAIARSSAVVVPSNVARHILEARYGIPAERVTVIPHGANWAPIPVNPPPHRRLVTWGLLGPGKGLERAIRAVALLGDLDPPVEYLIVGGTHPAVFARSGFAYRQSLEALVADLDVDDRVRFIDRYVEETELHELVSRADLVVAPYDNHQQVSSGVVTEAVALGRPVVATRFPHAMELLDPGPGITVQHDSTALAAAIHTVLSDPHLYADMAQAAAQLSARLSWSAVAEGFAAAVGDLIAARASA